MNRVSTRRGFITRLAAMAAIGPFAKMAGGTFVEPMSRAIVAAQREPLPVIHEPRIFTFTHEHPAYAFITYDCVGTVEVSIDGGEFKPGPQDQTVYVRRGHRERVVRFRAIAGARTARSSIVVPPLEEHRPRSLV